MTELDTDPELVAAFRVLVDHGLLIIRDVGSVDTHDNWADDADLDVTPDSIYLCVQHPVDGFVDVEIYEGEPDAEEQPREILFNGTISSMSGIFVVHDPLEDIRVVVRTDEPGPAHLRIAADVAWRPTAIQLNFWY